MKEYLDAEKLQEYTTKLVSKLKTVFPGAPTAVLTAAEMTDHGKTYVYAGTETGYTAGNWYYWNGSEWADGGVYNATALVTDTTLSIAGRAADAKATGDAVDELEGSVEDVTGNTLVKSGWTISGQKKYINLSGNSVTVVDGVITKTTSTESGSLIRCLQTDAAAGDQFTVWTVGGGASRAWGFVSASGAVLDKAVPNEVDQGMVLTAPADTAYFVVNDKNGDARVYSNASTLTKIDENTSDIVFLENQIKKAVFDGAYEFRFEWERGDIATNGQSTEWSAYRIRNVGFIDFDGVQEVKVSVPQNKRIRYYKYQSAALSSVVGSVSEWKTSDFAVPVNKYFYKFVIEDVPYTSGTYATPDGFAFEAETPDRQYISIPAGEYTSNFTAEIKRGSLGFKNIIFEARTKYTGSESPTIQFKYLSDEGTAVYTSIPYDIGDPKIYITQQFRIPPFPGNVNRCEMSVTIPSGTSLLVDYITNEYSNDKGVETPYRLNSHLGTMYPKNTYDAFMAAAKTGYRCCVANLRSTSDGVWVCLHDRKLGSGFDHEDGTSIVAPEANIDIDTLTYAQLLQYNRHSVNFDYMQIKVCTVEEFFDICMKTGMHPMFSVGIDIDTEGYQSIKSLAEKYHLLERLNMKGTRSDFITNIYPVFGDSIESYAIDISAKNVDITTSSQYAESFRGCTFNHSRAGVEYYYAAITQQKVQNALNAGLFVACFIQSNESSGAKYKELLSWGVSEITDDNNQSNGLNW